MTTRTLIKTLRWNDKKVLSDDKDCSLPDKEYLNSDNDTSIIDKHSIWNDKTLRETDKC